MRRRRRAAVTTLATLTALATTVATVDRFNGDPSETADLTTRPGPTPTISPAAGVPAGARAELAAASAPQPVLRNESSPDQGEGVSNLLVERMPNGNTITRWAAADGWMYDGGAARRPDGRLVVGVSRRTGDGDWETALQVAEPDGTVASTHPIASRTESIGILDATDTGVVLERYPEDGEGATTVVWHDLATGEEHELVDGLDPDGYADVAGGSLVQVRSSTCEVEVVDITGSGGQWIHEALCPEARGAANNPRVSPTGRWVAVDSYLGDGAEHALTVLDTRTGAAVYEWTYREDETTGEGPVADLTWSDSTTLRMFSPVPDQVPTDADQVTIDVVPTP